MEQGALDPEEIDHLLALSLSLGDDGWQTLGESRLPLDNDGEGPTGLSMSSELQLYLEEWAKGVNTENLYGLERVFYEFGEQNARLISSNDGEPPRIAIEGNFSFENLDIPALPPNVSVNGDLSFRGCSLPSGDFSHWTCNKLSLISCRGSSQKMIETLEANYKKLSAVSGLQSIDFDQITSAEEPAIIEVENCPDLEFLESSSNMEIVLKKLRLQNCQALSSCPPKVTILQKLELLYLPQLAYIGIDKLSLGTFTRIQRCPQLNTLCNGDLHVAGSLRIEQGSLHRLCEGVLYCDEEPTSPNETSIEIQCVDTNTPIAAGVHAPAHELIISGIEIPPRLCEGSIVVRSFSLRGSFEFRDQIMSLQSFNGGSENTSGRIPGLIVDEVDGNFPAVANSSELDSQNNLTNPVYEGSNHSGNESDDGMNNEIDNDADDNEETTSSTETLQLREWVDDIKASFSCEFLRFPIEKFQGKLETPRLTLRWLPVKSLPEWHTTNEVGHLNVQHCPNIDVLWDSDGPDFPVSLEIVECNSLQRLAGGRLQIQLLRITDSPSMERLAHSIFIDQYDDAELYLNGMQNLTQISDDVVSIKSGLNLRIRLENVGVENLGDIEGSGMSYLYLDSCNMLEGLVLHGIWQLVRVDNCEHLTRVDVGLATKDEAEGELSLYNLPLLEDIKLRTGCNKLKLSECPHFVGEDLHSDSLSQNSGNASHVEPIARPLDLGMLSGLRILNLRGSTGLRTIPGPLPQTLRTLNLSKCANLAHIPDDVFNAAPGRVKLQLDHCTSLEVIPAIHVASLSAQSCTQLRELKNGFMAGLISRVRDDGYVVGLQSCSGDVDLSGCSSLETFAMKFVTGDLNLSGTGIRELHPVRVLGQLMCTHMQSLEIVHPGSLVGQQDPGILTLTKTSNVSFRFCPRLRKVEMERVFGMLDISHCMALEEIGGSKMIVGDELPLVKSWRDSEIITTDVFKPGFVRLRNCPSLQKLPQEMICRGGLDIRYCMGLSDLSQNKIEVGWPALAGIPTTNDEDFTQEEHFGSFMLIGCPMFKSIPKRLTVYGDCLFAFLDSLVDIPDNGIYHGNLVVASCRALKNIPKKMQVRETFAIHSCDTFETLPVGFRLEQPAPVLSNSKAKRLRSRRKSTQQAERRLDHSIPVEWRSSSKTLEGYLNEHFATVVRHRQRAWTANSRQVDYKWLRRNTLLGGARRSITRLYPPRQNSSRVSRSKSSGSHIELDTIHERVEGQEELDIHELKLGEDEAEEEGVDEANLQEIAPGVDVFRDDDVSSQELEAEDAIDEDYLSEGTEDLDEEASQPSGEDALQQYNSQLGYTMINHGLLLSVLPCMTHISSGVVINSLALINLPELCEISPDLDVDIYLVVNVAPKLTTIPREILNSLLQKSIDAAVQRDAYKEAQTQRTRPWRRPSNWLTRVRSIGRNPATEPAIICRRFMLKGTGIDPEVLQAITSDFSIPDRLQCMNWIRDGIVAGDLRMCDAVFEREEDEENDLAGLDFISAGEEGGLETLSHDGDFESFSNAVLFWKAAATGRPPRLMRLLIESDIDFDVLKPLDEKVDSFYRDSVLTFLSMLRDSREYRNPSTRRGLAERVVEMLMNVAKDDEARDELCSRMADAIDACEDKPIWALNQLEVVGAVAHARGDREKLRALGRRIMNLQYVHEAAQKRIEDRGGFQNVDDVCVFLQYEIQFRLPLNLPVSAHFMVYGSTIPGEEVIRVSRRVLDITEEEFNTWLGQWVEWERQDRFEFARDLKWEDLPRNHKRVSLGRTTLMGDEIDDPIKLGRSTWSLSELLTHWVRRGMDFNNVHHSIQDMRDNLSRCDIVYVDNPADADDLSPKVQKQKNAAA